MTKIKPYRRWSDTLNVRAHRPRRADWVLINEINQQSRGLQSCSDEQISQHANEIRQLIDGGRSALDTTILVNAFAIVKEVARRRLGMPHYDQQLLAGIAMATGSIVQMQTGEGKTLTSSLPAALYGLTGKGVHVATVNAYLAERDFHTLKPIYESMGISVGLAADGLDTAEKRNAYACDVTYATGYELGFDFLRDQVSRRSFDRQPIGRRVRNGLRGEQGQPQCVQRGQAFVIIDEADSVLLDEANTPLILSASAGPSDTNRIGYERANALVAELVVDVDFVCEQREQQIELTETGAAKIHKQMPRAVNGLARPWSMYVEKALRANLLMQRDVQYVIRDDKVLIVDEYTGRIFNERTWRDGLHQAVEAKEGVSISEEKRSVAQVSRQRYFQMYDRISGMTGTALGHEKEFLRFYRLPIVSIPLRKPSRRKSEPTRYFANQHDKWESIAESVRHRHNSGQPILIGTRTIAASKVLAKLLTESAVPFRLLNGAQDEDEAALIKMAGEVGAVTIATNMAGRGTDIKPSSQALSLGGLHVIATERHDSQRIDRQMIGRAARQGDPGSCQFFVSSEDDLIGDTEPKLAGRIRQIATANGFTSELCDDAIRRIQSDAEKQKYQRRLQLMNQEVWLNTLRESVA